MIFNFFGTFFVSRLCLGFYSRFAGSTDLSYFVEKKSFYRYKFFTKYVDLLDKYFLNGPISGITTGGDYFAAQGQLCFMLAILFWWLGWMVGHSWNVLAVFIPIVGFLFTFLKAREHRQAFIKSVGRELPFALDFMGLCFSAGLDLNRSMALLSHGSSCFSREMARVFSQTSLGLSRDAALLELESRIPLASVRQFVMTIIQGGRQGSDLGVTLEQLARAFHTERFQKAEEQAGKISVRMMIPMMVFILPAVLIVMLGPLMLSYMYAAK